jgi:leader peptidase (prepilin peptidase) / N-methyltransferase
MVAVGVLGALVGSFLNVVIHRLPRGESLVSPRSHCPECRRPIGPRDNVPLLSWVVLRGRCRHCRTRISGRYPLVEALTVVTFVAVALTRGLHPELALYLPFAAMLIAVAGIDLDHRIIPNKVLLPAAVWAVAAGTLIHPGALPEMLIAGGSAFLFLLLAALAYPSGMGMGDVKLAGVMGLYLGAAVAPALLAAFLTGSVVGLALLLRQGASARKRGVPFAPFLALGGLLGLLVGHELIRLSADRFLS